MRGELPLHLHFKVFDQQIRPIIEYASDIWCQKMPIEALETTQLKYLKKTLGVFQSTPTLAVYGETGRFPLQLPQEDSMIRIWARIQCLPQTHFLRKIYKDLLLFYDQGHDTWAGRVKAIFAKYNITDENLEHTTSSELDIFLRKFHEVRYEQYQRKLISDIKDDDKNSPYIN